MALIRKSRKKRTTVFGLATGDDLDKIMEKTTKLEEASFDRCMIILISSNQFFDDVIFDDVIAQYSI